MSRSYYHPTKAKPPSPISQIGRIVRAVPEDQAIPPDEIFRRAFEPHENHDSFKSVLTVARARGYIERSEEHTARPMGGCEWRWRLTEKGVSVREAMG